jgi:hypothetical protein
MLRCRAIVHDNAMLQCNTVAILGFLDRAGGKKAWIAGALLLGFALGYGVREAISRHRRAEARRRHLMDNPF